MPVELRKRKAPVAAPAPPPPPKRKTAAAAAKNNAAAAATTTAASRKGTRSRSGAAAAAAAAATNGDKKENGAAAAAAAAPTEAKKKVAAGDVISLDDFGGEIETNDGKKTTLKQLVDESKSGVVLFTYPKASTPGCTNQACLFRDAYSSLTATGFAIYGLSIDSPTANTNFKTKQNLPYTLLCDPQATLIAAIGLKKAPKGTTRGVFVIDKQGKVLAAEPGGPAATVTAVKKVLGADAAADVAETAVAAGDAAGAADAAKDSGSGDAMDLDKPADGKGEVADEGKADAETTAAAGAIAAEDDKAKADAADAATQG